jgi:hypothetical protein
LYPGPSSNSPTSDRRGLRDEAERPGLFILKLDDVVVAADDLIGSVDGRGEEFGESEPLAGLFVAVVGVHE